MDIERQYQIKRGAKKLLKGGKDLRVGLLLLMASVDTVAGELTDYETEPNAYKFDRWALILCALVGALSVLHWLRYFVAEFMQNVIKWMKDTGAIMQIENLEEQRSSQDQELQVTQWLDCSLWAKYEEQIHDMEDQVNDVHEELLRAEGLIEELKVDLEMARQLRDENFSYVPIGGKESHQIGEDMFKFQKVRIWQGDSFSHQLPALDQWSRDRILPSV